VAGSTSGSRSSSPRTDRSSSTSSTPSSDRQLDALVSERLQARNGHAVPTIDADEKVGLACGRTLPPSNLRRRGRIAESAGGARETLEHRNPTRRFPVPCPAPATNGVAFDELVEKVTRTNAPISPDDLRGWLLGTKLATIGPDHLLRRPTEHGLELGAGLRD
jgi:hypothetical protein